MYSDNVKKVNSILTVLRALNRGKIKLESITRKWYSFTLNIQELVWDRNFIDGWEVDIYKNEIYLGTIQSNEATRGEFIFKRGV